MLAQALPEVGETGKAQSAEEARRAVAATRYPPQGVRGVSVAQRNNHYNTVKDYLKVINDNIAVMVQIENRVGVDAIDEICAVEGIDGVFIGPSDLAASMGLLGDIGNPAVQQKLQHGAQLCRKLGKPCGIIGTTPELVATFAGYGYDWIAVGSDMGFMVSRAQ